MFLKYCNVSLFFNNNNVLRVAQRQCSNFTTEPIVPVAQVKRFIEQCCSTVGIKHQHGQKLADCLIEADLRGHYSHGLNRLGKHVVFVLLLLRSKIL